MKACFRNYFLNLTHGRSVLFLKNKYIALIFTYTKIGLENYIQTMSRIQL